MQGDDINGEVEEFIRHLNSNPKVEDDPPRGSKSLEKYLIKINKKKRNNVIHNTNEANASEKSNTDRYLLDILD